MAGGSGWIVVYNRIPELMLAVEANARSAVKHTADKIAQTMRDNVPVDTGELHDSIESTSVSVGKEAEVVVGAAHGVFVNYGTRYQPAQPFFEPAIQAHEDEFWQAVGPGSVKL